MNLTPELDSAVWSFEPEPEEVEPDPPTETDLLMDQLKEAEKLLLDTAEGIEKQLAGSLFKPPRWHPLLKKIRKHLRSTKLKRSLIT